MTPISLNKKISASQYLNNSDITNEVETQTEKMPMIAIEDPHLDCIHGPWIVSPLDIAIYPPDKICSKLSIDLNTKLKSSQEYKAVSEFSEKKRQPKEIQTDFTSFTKPTHYHHSSDSFKKYLILDSSEDLPPNEIKKNAKAFNIDFFTKNSDLFSFKFIINYFFSHFKRSKL